VTLVERSEKVVAQIGARLAGKPIKASAIGMPTTAASASSRNAMAPSVKASETALSLTKLRFSASP